MREPIAAMLLFVIPIVLEKFIIEPFGWGWGVISDP